MSWGAQPVARCGTEASGHSSPKHHVQFLGWGELGEGLGKDKKHGVGMLFVQ